MFPFLGFLIIFLLFFNLYMDDGYVLVRFLPFVRLILGYQNIVMMVFECLSLLLAFFLNIVTFFYFIHISSERLLLLTEYFYSVELVLLLKYRI